MRMQNFKPRVAMLTLALTTVLTGLQPNLPAMADDPPPPPAPGVASVYGRSLAEWQELFWQWAFGQVSVPTDANGNAVVGDNVVLMPLPAAPGDGTPASLDVTLNVGQAFVLPLWNILGTSYDDGTPTDPALDESVFETLEIKLTIDGVTMVGSANVMEYYTAFEFDPLIPLPPEWSPYEAIVWLQGVGTVQPPLSMGEHTITLDVKNTQPVVDAKGNSYVFEYHNTWNVTVKSRK